MGTYYDIPTAIFCLLKGDYSPFCLAVPHSPRRPPFGSNLFGALVLRFYWVAVKELKLSYHNGYIYIK